MKFQLLAARPVVAGTGLSLVTLLVGTVALLAADQSAPVWVHLPLLLWLCSVGLPTTLGVLLLAAWWGSAPPMYGLGGFIVTAFICATFLQVVTIHLIEAQRRRTQ